MIKKIMALSIIGLLLAVGLLAGCLGTKTWSADYNILATDAPAGKYWVQTWGHGGGFLVFYFDLHSRLQESYTMKYMDGEEYKTIILASTDFRLHVILTDDNTSMKLHVVCTWEDFSGGNDQDARNGINIAPNENGNTYFQGASYSYTYYLYIPRPEICRISNETIS